MAEYSDNNEQVLKHLRLHAYELGEKMVAMGNQWYATASAMVKRADGVELIVTCVDKPSLYYFELHSGERFNSSADLMCYLEGGFKRYAKES